MSDQATQERQKRAKKAVAKIITDITDRKGLGNEWEAIDADVQKEIKRVWTCAIAQEFMHVERLYTIAEVEVACTAAAKKILDEIIKSQRTLSGWKD